mgnify:CR=1 FL=1
MWNWVEFRKNISSCLVLLLKNLILSILPVYATCPVPRANNWLHTNAHIEAPEICDKMAACPINSTCIIRKASVPSTYSCACNGPVVDNVCTSEYKEVMWGEGGIEEGCNPVETLKVFNFLRPFSFALAYITTTSIHNAVLIQPK